MGRRTLLLIVSVLVAAIGTALIGLYVKGANERADDRAIATYGPLARATPTPTPTAVAHHQDIDGLAITIEVPDQDRAVGLLAAGDRVAIYYTTKLGAVPKPPVVPSVKVISVGAKRTVTSAATGEDVPATILGLDVTPDQARAIWAAQAKGDLHIAILGKASTLT